MRKFIKIETMIGCNAHCLFCPMGAGILKRKRGQMSTDFFFKIVDQAVALGFDVSAFFMNEPLMEPRIFEFFDYLRGLGKKQRLSTNAGAITKEVARRLSQYQYESFSISFHGGNKKDYEKVMGLNFEESISNIKYLISLQAIPNYVISMKITEENKNSVNAFKDLWKGYKFNVGKAINWAGSLGKGPGISRCRVLGIPCVFWDGRMPLCCLDAEGKAIVGDLRELSLKEVLSGKIYQTYFDFNNRNKLHELYPCSACDRE